MNSPDIFRINEALSCYQNHVRRRDFFAALKSRNLRVSGSISSRAWELVGSCLVDSMGSGKSAGLDLNGWEVKSVTEEARNFEYQYHRDSYEEKLKDDKDSNHLYFVYSEDYEDVLVYWVKPPTYDQLFDQWLKEAHAKYSNKDNLRFRRLISVAKVKEVGKIVMEIKGGELAEAREASKKTSSPISSGRRDHHWFSGQ